MNELVLIGQELDQESITHELTKCLVTEAEAKNFSLNKQFADEWPI
jgi:hypothetical protein